MEMDEEAAVGFVRVLYECMECNAHKLPPRAHANQYNAEEFDKESVQKVDLCLKTWSYERAAIEIRANGELFAVCPLDGTTSSESVERAVGSSRYFALKVASNTGKRAYLGISFKERTEAFDFLAGLQEWDERRVKLTARSDVEDDAVDKSVDCLTSPTPMRDLSLKQGEKIVLKIKRAGQDDEPNKPPEQPSTALSPGGLAPPPSSLLAPPPSGGTRRRGQRDPNA